MSELRGRTIFITGASRGIGRAIALRCARDGAQVVITGKTAEPHAKLEGTIHTVAREVEAAGGQALALQLDVRGTLWIGTEAGAARWRDNQMEMIAETRNHAITGIATAANKDVLLVEDIVDSGLTVQYLMKTLAKRKPKSVNVCTLLSKPERRVVDVHVRYTGFTIPDQYVIGYGLDYQQKYRNLPYLAVLDQSSEHDA